MGLDALDLYLTKHKYNESLSFDSYIIYIKDLKEGYYGY